MFFRVWKTLGDFIRVQAVVSVVDAVFIGLGLVVLGVPLAGALAVLTFFAGFIHICQRDWAARHRRGPSCSAVGAGMGHDKDGGHHPFSWRRPPPQAGTATVS